MYEALRKLSERPSAFSVYTAETLWTDAHLAKMMLETHLSQETALASRPTDAIDRVVDWIDHSFGLRGRAVCDLGCGPGLYSNRFAQRGADVCGLDFSLSSIDCARRHASSNDGSVTYRVSDYLTDPLPENQDLITLIYCDLCPLSAEQRRSLLTKVRRALAPGGRFIFDVYSKAAFETVAEGVLFERRLMNGFWSANDYFAFQSTFRYENEAVSLDHFTIIEEHRIWHVYNWLQYFSKEDIRRELRDVGFSSVEFVEGFDVDPSDESTFGVVADVSQ